MTLLISSRLAKALSLLAVTLAACQPQEPPPAKPATLVQVQTVALLDHAPTLRLTGELQAQAQSDLAFRVSGRVTERRADVGDHVVPNQVLARIAPDEQQANITAAEAAVKAAEAQLQQATSTFERQRILMLRGYTTRRELDQAEEAARTARGTLDSAKAQLSTAQEALSQTVLRAGAAGVITARNLEVGQVMQAAQTAFTIARDGPRDAIFSVQESVFIHEPADRTVTITLVADPQVHATGTVREVSPTVDPASGTVRVKVGIERPPAAMSLGSAVVGEGRFTPRQLIALPWSALASEAGKAAVWVVDPESRAVSKREVTVEEYETGRVLVREGLRPGEIVVTAGAQLLHPSQVVAWAEERTP